MVCCRGGKEKQYIMTSCFSRSEEVRGYKGRLKGNEGSTGDIKEGASMLACHNS